MHPGSEPGDWEPKLARRSPFVLSNKLCPRCLSTLKPRSELGGWLVPQDYYCAKCGYAGTVYLEKDADSATGDK